MVVEEVRGLQHVSAINQQPYETNQLAPSRHSLWRFRPRHLSTTIIPCSLAHSANAAMAPWHCDRACRASSSLRCLIDWLKGLGRGCVIVVMMMVCVGGARRVVQSIKQF